MVISHKNEEKGEYCVKVKRFRECPDCHRIVPYLQRKCDCGYVFSGGEREYKTCVACGSLIPASRLFCDCGKFLPIQRDTLTEGNVETAYQEGRFACGIGKKVLLANNIGLLWETASAQAAPTVLTACLGVIAYGFQICFEFSGYSDMAIGLGRMLGFRFLENFNYHDSL